MQRLEIIAQVTIQLFIEQKKKLLLGNQLIIQLLVLDSILKKVERESLMKLMIRRWELASRNRLLLLLRKQQNKSFILGRHYLMMFMMSLLLTWKINVSNCVNIWKNMVNITSLINLLLQNEINLFLYVNVHI